MNVSKSIEITDAKIQFVSLVDKAANKRDFLITKKEGDSANFTTSGRIIKVDNNAHFVTGVVYEPMAADAHDNFMTEAEIEKAAHWFLKNGDKVDIQHSFQEADGVAVVESSVTKADCTIEGEEIKKGTWLMTVEITNDDIWASIQKGEITGLSMGGVGKYATTDTDLNAVGKSTAAPEAQAEPVAKTEEADEHTTEKRGLFKRLASLLGFDVVEKGELADIYNVRIVGENFWTAVYALRSILFSDYDYRLDACVPIADEAKTREALEDFSKIITDLLSTPDSVGLAKALQDGYQKASSKAEADAGEAVEKAGKKMSRANRDKLKGICDSLSEFLKEFDDPDDDPDDPDDPDDNDDKDDKEEINMTKDEVQKMIEDAVAKSAAAKTETPDPAVEKAEEAPEALTREAVAKMIEEAVAKAVKPAEEPAAESVEKAEEPEALTKESVSDMISEAIAKALQAHGVPTSTQNEPVAKSDEQHYLHGLL